MMNNERRKFLHRSSMLVASTALTACGGGGAEGGTPTATAAGVTTAPAPADTAPTAPSEPTAPTSPTPTAPTGPTSSIGGARFTLSSSTGRTDLPFCLGFAFRRGDVAAGRTVAGDKGNLQVAVKNRWPDGSIKFAVLSGQAQLVGGAPLVVSLSSMAEQAAAPALETARLRSLGTVAEIGCGAFGAASWQGADWDTPFQTWVKGPHMSSWIYRKSVGTDAHLVAWLEVRLWASGAVEILPWIENGYLRVADPTNKPATYTFSFNGSQRVSVAIDLKHHQRTPLISGSALSYWAGADAGVLARPDPAYLQATELVPSYQARMGADAAVVKQLVAAFQPLQAGNVIYDQDNMPAAGYQDPIGLLPQHDVLYLVADVPSVYAAVVRNGYSAGRYGIHYRDETTQRPPRFASYPNLALRSSQGFAGAGGSTKGQVTPVTTGGNPPGWEVAHSPAVGFLPYLLTGRWYFMEEVQFANITNYLGKGDSAILRNGSAGLVQTCPGAWQTRSCAWEWRARVMALCVTPDDDAALRADLIASVEANIEHFHGQYVAKPNNPYGWVKPGEVYNNSFNVGAPWQQDFVTAAFGYSLCVGLPVTAAAASKLSAFFAWKARSAVMRLGTRDAFWYINATPYTMKISTAAKPDFDSGAGPWLANERAVYDETYAVAPAWMGKVDGVLAAEFMPGERALWGNLMPAIAYAVRHNVSGAREAYERILNASNYAGLRDAFNVRPVWSVKPSQFIATVPVPVTPPTQTGDPSWLTGQALGQWFEIPGTSGAGGSAVDAYSGLAFNEQTNEILIASAGGHLDSADNRIVAMRLTDNAPYWRQIFASSSAFKMDAAYYVDGTPAARHLYSHTHYIPQLNRIFHFGARSTYGNAHTFASVDAFNLTTNTWDAPGTYENMMPGHFGAVVVRGTGEVWSTGLARWSPLTNTWTQPITRRTQSLVRWPIAHDSRRHQLFTLNWADGLGYNVHGVYATRIPLDGNQQFDVTIAPGAALDTFIAEKPTYAGMDYDAVNDQFMFFSGQGTAAGRIYVIKPNATNTWEMSIFPLTNGVLPPAVPDAGSHNRFRYVPALRGFMLLPKGRSNLFFIRTSA